MTRKSKRQPATTWDICKPIATFVATPRGLQLAPGSTTEDAWNNLLDVGRRLSLPHNTGETLNAYATRLRVALEPFDRDQYIDGAAVYMLRLTIDLYAPPKKASQSSP